MIGGSVFDDDASRKLEAAYLTPDVVAQRRETLRALALQPGERVLDIGAGPGLLVAEMAEVVGPSGRVTGLEISDSMLALGGRRCADPSIRDRVTFVKADAVALPFPDGTFDVAVSTQVYEYVTDLKAAFAELHRVLRPGGRALIIDTDWDSIVWHSSDYRRMERVLAAFEEHLVDPHLPRTLRGSLARAGFEVARPQILPLFNVGYERATYSAGLLEIIAGFVAARGGFTPSEAKAWAEDLRSLGPDYFFSINRYLFCATTPV
jgi:SAM-dependent methyltransferase